MDAAELIAKALERRGHFVEHEGGDHVGRDLAEQDGLVLIWSAAMAADGAHLIVERRALDAWAEGRLVLVKLDGTDAPLGLRDLPAVQTMPGDWPALQNQTVAALEQALRAPPPSRAPPLAAESAAAPAPVAARKPKKTKPAKAKGGGLGGLFWMLALLALIGAGAYGFDQIRYAVFDLPTTIEAYVAPGAGVLVSLILLIWLFRKGFAASDKKPAAETGALHEDDEPVAQTGGPVFVSYAHDDAVAVGPVVAAVERAGRPVWIDKSDISAGAGWAGEIVRAIRNAEGVMVLCTPAAFRSDHVKREVYLADRYRKPLLPVMLAPAPLPEDFEYFFAGLQWLELHRLAETERAAAIKQALHGAA